VDQPALWNAVAIRAATTAAATTAAWVMAGGVAVLPGMNQVLRPTGLPQRASTVALAALIATELGQTLVESQAPLVVLTALGSLGFVGVLISIPGVSQLLGCTPLDPLGWIEALGSAAVATAAVAVLSRVFDARELSEPPPAPQPPEPPQSPGRPRATGTHRVATSEHAGTRQSVKSADRPADGRSSPYVRR
jgi:cation-transporting P-type ATPase I